MKSFLYILAFLIAICSDLSSQNFNVEYGLAFPASEDCIGKALDYKGHYVALISSQTSSSTNYSIIELNNYGNVLKTINIEDSVSFTCLDWVKANDGNYYILTKETKGKDIYEVYLLKYNNDLIFKFKKQINFEYTYPHNLKLKSLSNGNISMFGTAGPTFIIYQSVGIYYELDTETKVIKKMSYQGVGFATWGFSDFASDTQGNIYFLGSTTNPKFMTSDYFILKYTSGLSKVWEKFYKLNSEWFSKIHITNGNLVCMGRNLYGTTGKHYGQLVMSIKNSSGNTISNKSFFTYETFPNDCIVDSEGNIICSGFSYLDTLNNSGFIIKLSGLGDSIWSKSFTPYKSNKHSFNKIKSTDDGGYILTGSLVVPSDTTVMNNKQAWIVKLDSLGIDSFAKIPEPEYDSINVNIYPNPTTGKLYYNWMDIDPDLIDSYSLEIYTIQGQLIRTFKLNSQSINLDSFTAGLYPYIIKFKNNEIIKTGKIVLVQRKQ